MNRGGPAFLGPEWTISYKSYGHAAIFFLPNTLDNARMTRPRSALIDREDGGFYHLGSRCVRRAALCGEDPLSGRDLSHRRTWVENQLLRLADIFTVDVYAYAVMSNHYHITVHYRPRERHELAEEEVAERWLRLFPPRRPEEVDRCAAELLRDPARLANLREHLGDLSWYMRCLNEPVARRANHEDDCTGRFWQGRCHTKALPDERAFWACMAYDDLNPLRAGLVDRLEDADHTALQRRLAEALKTPARFDQPLAPLALRASRVVSMLPSPRKLEMTLREYRAHAAWTAGKIYNAPTSEGRPSVGQLGDAKSWLTLVESCRRRSYSAGLPRSARGTDG